MLAIDVTLAEWWLFNASDCIVGPSQVLLEVLLRPFRQLPHQLSNSGREDSGSDVISDHYR